MLSFSLAVAAVVGAQTTPCPRLRSSSTPAWSAAGLANQAGIQAILLRSIPVVDWAGQMFRTHPPVWLKTDKTVSSVMRGRLECLECRKPSSRQSCGHLQRSSDHTAESWLGRGHAAPSLNPPALGVQALLLPSVAEPLPPGSCYCKCYKKLSCRRENAPRFVSLHILLSHSRSLNVIRNDTVD